MRAAAVPDRRFAIHGPCDPGIHYLIDPIERDPRLPRLLVDGTCVAVRGPQRSGRTTLLSGLVEPLLRLGVQPIVIDCAALAELEPAAFEKGVIDQMRRFPAPEGRPAWRPGGPWQMITVALSDWARIGERPVVVLVDDIDRLDPVCGGTLRAQLAHSGAHAILLAGTGDLRGADSGRLGRDLRCVRLPDFDAAAIAELYGQHAAAAGDQFTEDALGRVADWTGGQPWLVNAMARELFDGLGVRRRVQIEHVDRAAAGLLDAWPMWFQDLGRRLEDPAVLRAVAPLLIGSAPVGRTADADIDAARDAGVLAGGRAEPTGALQMAAALKILGSTFAARLDVHADQIRRLDGGLDLPRVINTFQSLWAARGRALAAEHRRPRLAAVVVATALLERLVPPGSIRWAAGFGARQLTARVERTLSGRRRQRAVVAIKQRSPDDPHPLDRGLSDLDRAIAATPDAEGALVLFDHRSDAPSVGARVAWVMTPAGREVMVVRG